MFYNSFIVLCNDLVYMDAGQLVCDANELAGFYVVWVSL